MATIATQLNSGSGFASGEVVTATKLNSLVNTATVTGIVNADIDASAAIAASKLALSGAITATELATGAVTGAAGGGKLAASAITGQTTIADALAATDEFLVHDASASSLRKVAFSSMAQTGSFASSSTSSNTSITTVIPLDNTIPQQTEGTEVLTVTITPTSASNKVVVHGMIFASGNNPTTTLAVFRGATANAIYAQDSLGSFYFVDSPATASAVTYKVRIGMEESFYSLTLNGTARYGGTKVSTLAAMEVKG